MVWIESTISSAGRTRSAASSTAEISVSVSTSNVSWPSAVLSARSLICSADSSPETYNTDAPVRAISVAAWSTRVDLPIPGSPPSRTSDPGTNPPPRTRFSSAISTGSRAIVLVCKSPSRTGAAPVVRLAARAPEDCDGAIVSTSESHVRQLGQRPSIVGLTNPHCWQT